MGTSLHLFESFELFLHYAILFVQVVYMAFAFIQLRQVHLMNSSLQTPLAPIFRMAARIHLFVAIGLFIVSLLVLL